jgi:hypothetical protein
MGHKKRKDIILHPNKRFNFYVIPECEFYTKEGFCIRKGFQKETFERYPSVPRFNCNEIWCEKKVYNEDFK